MTGGLSRGRYADDDGTAGPDRTALNGLECLIEADFYGCQVVVSATYGKALPGDLWVVFHEEVHDLIGGHGGLLGKSLEFLRDGDGFVGSASGGEEGVGWKAGAGAVGMPLVEKKALVRVDVSVGGGIGWARSRGAVFGVGAVVVLRPETVQDKGRVRGALGSFTVGVAELR